MSRWCRAAITLSACFVLAGCETLALLAGFPAPVLQVAAPLPIELAYREARGGIVVLTGRVNGIVDVDFVLDTGAPVSVLIDGETTQPLRIDTSGARKLGPAGDPAVPTGVIARGFELAFGDVRLSGLSAVVLPEAMLACPERYRRLGFAGVIGADLFRHFVVEIDPSTRHVRLHDPAAWRVPAGATVVPLVFVDGHPYVEARVTSRSGASLSRRMHLDTGMNFSLAATAGTHPALPMPEDAPTETSCFVGGMRETRVGEAVDVQLAEVRFDGVRPTLSHPGDAPRVQAGGAVGSSLLAGHRHAIDYTGRRLVLIEPARRL